MLVYRFLAIHAPIALIGCGAAVSDFSTTAPDLNLPTQLNDETLSFQYYNEIGQTITENINFADTTNLSDLSPQGEARYDGVLTVSTNIDGSMVQLMGAMNVDVSFQSNSISGSVLQIVDSSNQVYQGQLLLDSGKIDRTADLNTDFSLTAELEGTLFSSQAGNLHIEGWIFGDFYSDETDILGIVEGSSISDGLSTNIEAGAFVLSE